MIEILGIYDRYMQGCVPFVVLNIDEAAPRLQIVDGSIGRCVASPVQGRAALVIQRVHADALFLKIAQAVCLIALSGHMQHVEPTARFDKWVGPMLDK